MKRKTPAKPRTAPQSHDLPQEAPTPTLEQVTAANAVLARALTAVATDLQALRDYIVKLVGQ